MAIPASAIQKYRSDEHNITFQADITNTNRLLLVNVPYDYDTSNLNYPVVYMLHGSGGDAGQVGGRAVIEDMVANRQIPPVIVVQPSMVPRSGNITTNYQQYLSQDVVNFVDANYRTIPTRNGRAVAGWSMGGTGAIITALNYPEIFSMVGAYAPGDRSLDRDVPKLLRTHKQHHFPLHFFIRHGRNDNVVPSPRPFIDILENLHWPHIYEETDGNHDTIVEYVNTYTLFTPSLWKSVYTNDYHLRRITRTFTTTAGSPAHPLDIEVQLQTPADQPTPDLHVDLSALNESASLPLSHDGQGHYRSQPQITPPTQSGVYRLPVWRTVAGNEPEFLFNIELQVFPAGEQPLFNEDTAQAWETTRTTLDAQATDQVLEGTTSLKMDAGIAFNFGRSLNTPLEGFGYRLRFAFYPEDVKGTLFTLALKGSGDNARRIDLGPNEDRH
jgi:enterochelin esterase-like enzyme